jgi:hypothetical protein
VSLTEFVLVDFICATFLLDLSEMQRVSDVNWPSRFNFLSALSGLWRIVFGRRGKRVWSLC